VKRAIAFIFLFLTPAIPVVAQHFRMDNVVLENIVMSDADAKSLYISEFKKSGHEAAAAKLKEFFAATADSSHLVIYDALLDSYSAFAENQLYEALKYNCIASKKLTSKYPQHVRLANKLLSILIFEKYGDLMSADRIIGEIVSGDPVTFYQIEVYSAHMNLKVDNYQDANDHFMMAATIAEDVSVFDHYYTYFYLSKTAALLGNHMEQLASAVIADSILSTGGSKMTNDDIEYLFSTGEFETFLDSLKCDSKLNVSIAYRKTGQYEKSLEVMDAALEKNLAKNNQQLLGELYLNKGISLVLLEEYNDAGFILNDALKIFLSANNHKKIAETYNLLAKNNFLNRDFGLVLEECNQAIDHAKQVRDLSNLCAGYLILSETYAMNNDYVSSQKYYKLYVASKEELDRQLQNSKLELINRANETKVLLQKIETDILENEKRGIELLNAKMNATQREQEIIFLKQQGELREKDFLNKQLEKDHIERNLLLMQEQLANEQLQKEFLKEQSEKEIQIAENKNKENELTLLNTQKDAAEKETMLKSTELKASAERQNMVLGIMAILILFLIFLVYFIFKFRKQKRIIEKNNETIQITNKELVVTIEQVNTQKELIEAKNEEITDSITYAKRIQNAILPPEKFFLQHLTDNFIFYKPKDIVAGDFYWLSVQKDCVLFSVADCTGHGVPGALVSVVCHSALNRAVKEFKLTQPAAILNKVREIILETFGKGDENVNDGMDIALCSLDTRTNTLQFAGANNGIFVLTGGELVEVKSDKQPIGKFIDPKPFTNNEIKVNSGDLIYLYSDGYADQFGGSKGKKLKTTSFREVIKQYSQEKLSEQKHLLEQFFENWRGELEQLDDVCVMGVKI